MPRSWGAPHGQLKFISHNISQYNKNLSLLNSNLSKARVFHRGVEGWGGTPPWGLCLPPPMEACPPIKVPPIRKLFPPIISYIFLKI